ncbi:hypothetical protein FACS18948_6300 [Clostridia bacterium]|nr:hypothetical protein FACS18948_6300 [Clostridia bacterium]
MTTVSSSHGQWVADAAQIINLDDIDKRIYHNATVDNFIYDNNKFCVISPKGCGKTLLLLYKRSILEGKYGKSATFIPKSNNIEIINSIRSTLSDAYLSKMQNWEYCRKIWMTIIQLSVISNCDIGINENLFINLPKKSLRQRKRLLTMLSLPRSVDYILNDLLATMSESALTRFIEDISNETNELYKSIRKSVYVFLDQIDNALEASHDAVWVSIQAGLLEAVWAMLKINKHVKIYLSIRQEAFVKHTSANMTSIYTSVARISYLKDELKQLLDHLILFHEGKNNIEDFFGFSEFPNTVTYQNEDVFSFLYRYSIGRPRDYVCFCDGLNESRVLTGGNISDYDRKIIIKEEIRNISARSIIKNLYEELHMFFKSLNTIDEFKEFVKLLDHNVMKYEELQSICREFNINHDRPCNMECDKCNEHSHPFCDLYNMGLLGLVEFDNLTKKKTQNFKSTYTNMTAGLRNNIAYYLVHPALREFIHEVQMSAKRDKNYVLYDGILIGDRLTWTEDDDAYFTINRLIYNISRNDVMEILQESFRKYLQGERPDDGFDTHLRKNYPKLSVYENKTIDAVFRFLISGNLVVPKPITVFISYAYDNEEHANKVIAFNQKLRVLGFDSYIDKSLELWHRNIDEMMTAGLKMDKIIIVLSPEYKKRADNQMGGVWKEFKMISDDLELHENKYIFVSFDAFTTELKSKVSPRRIGNSWVVDLDKDKNNDFGKLRSYLTEKEEYKFREVISEYTTNVEPIPRFPPAFF